MQALVAAPRCSLPSAAPALHIARPSVHHTQSVGRTIRPATSCGNAGSCTCMHFREIKRNTCSTTKQEAPRMKCSKILAALLACASLAAIPAMPAHAAINSMSLGASYNAQKTQVTFRVYSSQATRIVLYLYASSYGAQEATTYLMSNQGGGVWQVIVPVSSIQGAGITGSVYYGYCAWGPNWPYNASWTKGSSAGFISDVDSNGNRFNPNKLLFDPYAQEISQDPLNTGNQNTHIFATGATVDASFGTAYRLIDSG